MVQLFLFCFALVTSREPVFQNCKEIILSALSCSLANSKQTLKLLLILLLTLFCYLPINIADLKMSFHGQVGSYWSNFYLASQLTSQCVSHQHQVIRGCVLCLGIVSYMFTKILSSFCTEIDKPALKYPARYRGLSSIFE